ncbi:MAG: solute carrier family 26 protein [Myxococcales bacterium]|nr:solute carrier family 26 protein [Myxococcales bacterium]
MQPARLLPMLSWVRGYRRQDLRGDITAGLTTAVMLIPQGMGYAMLAGLPPIVGLYAALVPLLIYAALGTSRQLAVGPVAMDSLLVAVAVGAIAETGTESYLAYAVLLGAMVGVIQLGLGVLGLGFVVNFLSRPVISGFTSAAALIIGFSQLSNMLAIELPRTHHVHDILLQALGRAEAWHLITLAIGASSVALLVVLKRAAPQVPRAMVAVTLATFVVVGLGLHDRGVAIVGNVPAGLPALAVPSFTGGDVLTLLPAALTIALVAFIEAISVGKHFARLGRYEIRPGQELIALGAANLGGSFFGGYPITGGFSRTAVNAQAGARTPMAGVVTAVVVALTLLLLTPLFHYVPKAALAAIIMTAVLGLFDLAEPRRLWRVKRADFALLLFTFVMTLSVGIQYGILLGVGASVLNFAVQTTRPHFAVLGRIPGTEAYLNVERHPHVVRDPGVLIVRIDAQFYFGNVTFLKETLRALEEAASEPLEAVVLDASGINQLDSSAEDALREIDRDYRERGIRLLLSHVKGPVRDVMHRTGLLATLADERRIFLRTHDAVLAASGDYTGRHSSPAGPDDPRDPADRIGCGPLPGAA